MEAQKIEVLQLDLSKALADFESELEETKNKTAEIDSSLKQIEAQLQKSLVPASGAAQSELRLLVQTRTLVAKGTTLQQSIDQLAERLAAVQAAQKERIPKPSFEPRATTSSASEFCEIVEELLSAWNYPDLGSVAFDTGKCDLVIAGKDRANTGKGYRAITHAAFVIGLMKYCRKKAIPHPGFVVLDTPVNPYKGPSQSRSDKLSDDVKAAFFSYLARDESGDQFIIMENYDPPRGVIESATYYNFTRNSNVGRYGFFPQRTVQGK